MFFWPGAVKCTFQYALCNLNIWVTNNYGTCFGTYHSSRGDYALVRICPALGIFVKALY